MISNKLCDVWIVFADGIVPFFTHDHQAKKPTKKKYEKNNSAK